ncbi:uncharacterized protein LOC123265646 [Cotesia glomerata]|uniref:Uncharacterized protein n=1 Tax=Cotesia glomerata TaxID=32391 RepID=A0AAV7J017_COTGL|nr:uncharacterized protein LOC123265646 [Cotesia glomerata]KAH0561574.1 hypothetical protein KQX54_017774 [Cotesia glomerata]
MAKDLKTFKNDIDQVFFNLFRSNELIVMKNLNIWLIFILILTIAVIIIRIAEFLRKESKKVEQKNLSSEEIQVIKDGMIKGNVTLNHIKKLRALHVATERCYLKKNAKQCIEILTYCPHLVNVKQGPEGLTPFHRICNHGHSVLMSFMLSKGADPFLTTNSGENALCLAISWCIKHPTGGLACVEILQQHGCRLDNTNKWFRIYLHAASLAGHKNLVRWMYNQAAPLAFRSSSFPLI